MLIGKGKSIYEMTHNVGCDRQKCVKFVGYNRQKYQKMSIATDKYMVA